MDVRNNLWLLLEMNILHNEVRDAYKYGEYLGDIKILN